MSLRRCPRTTATAFFAHSSVPSLLRSLASKYPVGEERISEDHGRDNDCSGEHEYLAQPRTRRAPDRKAKRHNHRKHDDCKTCNPGSDHHHARGQGTNVVTLADTSKQNESCNQHGAAYCSEQQRMGLPYGHNAWLNGE